MKNKDKIINIISISLSVLVIVGIVVVAFSYRQKQLKEKAPIKNEKEEILKIDDIIKYTIPDDFSPTEESTDYMIDQVSTNEKLCEFRIYFDLSSTKEELLENVTINNPNTFIEEKTKKVHGKLWNLIIVNMENSSQTYYITYYHNNALIYRFSNFANCANLEEDILNSIEFIQ